MIQKRQIKPMASAGLALLGAILMLVVWELAVRVGILNEAVIPAFSTTFISLIDLFTLQGYWIVVLQTLQSWFIGLMIVIVLGIPLGILLGSNRKLDQLFNVQIELLRPIPPVVLLPIVLLILGATLPMKLVLVVYGAIWPIVVQARSGVKATEPLMLDAARSYRLPGNYVFRFVRLPSALPMIVTGVRVSATMALVVSVVAEMVGGAPGIGSQILVAQSRGDAPVTFALIVTAGVLGLFVSYLFLYLEKRALFWHPSVRSQA